MEGQRTLDYTDHSVGVPCHACERYVYFEREAIVEDLDPEKFFLCHHCHERDMRRNLRPIL